MPHVPGVKHFNSGSLTPAKFWWHWKKDRRCKEQSEMETNDVLWRPLKETDVEEDLISYIIC